MKNIIKICKAVIEKTKILCYTHSSILEGLIIMKRIRRSKAKNRTIFLVTTALVLTIGYAAFAQPLAHRLDVMLQDNSRFGLWYGPKENNEVNNNNNNRAISYTTKKDISYANNQVSNKQWEIGFIEAERINIKGNASEVEPVAFTGLYATFNVLLSGPGDSVTYDFTIKNKGNIDAKLDSYDIITDDSQFINFDVKSLSEGEVLKVNETKKIRVTASFDSMVTDVPSGENQTVEIVLRYVQK